MPDLKAYLNALASAQPTPGGGSAATVVGALGAALVAMVARITLGNRTHDSVHSDALELVAAADALRSRFVAAREEDENAYTAVVRAQALPRAQPAERSARAVQLQAALAGAAEAPLRVAALAAELHALCERAVRLRNRHLVSDLECALAFAQATLDASIANVRINHRFMTDSTIVGEQTHRVAAILESANAAAGRARAAIAEE